MKHSLASFSAFLLLVCTCAFVVVANVAGPSEPPSPVAASPSETQGSLNIIDSKGAPAGLCPLKHTDVKAEISGGLSRVVVTQEFENPYKEKIEAVYTFPLPQNSAVDDMTMYVGDRVVRGRIKRREEARAVYEAARAGGQVASLLDQERPNIFTQSVANIVPGAKVKIVISYVEALKYEDGTYEFVFPMVVGPRYVPGTPTGKQAGGRSPDTASVPDASRITPHVAPEGTRAGHDISIEVAIDAGVPIEQIKSTLHEVEIDRLSPNNSVVRLKDKSAIPNKDFILKCDVAGRKVEDGLLTHRSDRGGFFTLLLQPPDRVTSHDVTPKELVFVIDTSGSMSGFPIEKAKETMKLALDGLYPQDTFNLITFAGDTHVLFEEPVPATPSNLRQAQAFLESRTGGGGTEMMKAIRAALEPSDRQNHIRIVCFMTDGYVGNDMEIISEVQKHANARVFSFGIGSSVNRFLLDKMAEQGRGEVEYVSLNDDGSAAAKRFHERVRNPLLTDISIDWGGLPVADVYPARIPDLFSAKPLIVCGRYKGSGRGVIRLKGKMSGREFVREVAVDLPESEPRRDVLATLWARARIDDLMNQDFAGLQRGAPRAEVSEAITQLGLEFRLMTQFTSFVAVEEMTITDGGEPRRIEVPVDMPEGVMPEGVSNHFVIDGADSSAGIRISKRKMAQYNAPAPPISVGETGRQQVRVDRSGKGSGTGGGAGSGSGGGVGPGSGHNMGGASGNVGGRPASPPEVPPLSKEEELRREYGSKLHPSLVAVVARLRAKGAQPSAEEARFVRGGKALIQVWLKDRSKETLAALGQLGFEVLLEPGGSSVVIGRVPIEKLEALAALQSVSYAAPMDAETRK
ncbi:MAG TPA: VIT and VWA domain-containing protein [Blastocatellia bacterium]|nr:VIT and VWA domain-containing protein [Blastocatellia bacterium]